MSYPQPSSDEATIGGLEFWRLNTPLVSPGDIYESLSSCRGFAVGPDSDIASVQIRYLDATRRPTLMNSFEISPTRSFVGLVNAQNDEAYPSAAAGNRPGRILISSGDIYDPSYRPIGYNPADDAISFTVPVLDVIQYFVDPPSLIPGRSDKDYQFKWYSPAIIGSGVQWIILPFYGRKYANLQIANFNGAGAFTWQVRGVDFVIEDNPAQHIETVLQAPVAVANSGGRDDLVVRATVNGMFDVLAIGITGGIGPLPLRVQTSDTES